MHAYVYTCILYVHVCIYMQYIIHTNLYSIFFTGTKLKFAAKLPKSLHGNIYQYLALTLHVKVILHVVTYVCDHKLF